jgi:hypothetical protein
MAHDVEALLTNRYQRQFDLSDPEDQAVFREYAKKQFWLADKDKTLLRRTPPPSADWRTAALDQAIRCA